MSNCCCQIAVTVAQLASHTEQAASRRLAPPQQRRCARAVNLPELFRSCQAAYLCALWPHNRSQSCFLGAQAASSHMPAERRPTCRHSSSQKQLLFRVLAAAECCSEMFTVASFLTSQKEHWCVAEQASADVHMLAVQCAGSAACLQQAATSRRVAQPHLALQNTLNDANNCP